MATEIKDPGIGTQFKQKTQRIIAQDGSYNLIKRGGQNGFRDVFKYLLEISWWWFFTLLFIGYILINLVFAGAYYLIGVEHITGIDPSTSHPFLQCFFFSGQTFTTVGYGALAPTGLPTQILATVEAFLVCCHFPSQLVLLIVDFLNQIRKLFTANMSCIPIIKMAKA